MEIKKHFKLYKAGKLWCCAAIATVTLAAGMTATHLTASADTNVATNATSTQVTSQANNHQVTATNQATSTSASQTAVAANHTQPAANASLKASAANNQETTNPVNQSTPVKTDHQSALAPATKTAPVLQPSPAQATTPTVTVPTTGQANSTATINSHTYHYGSDGKLYQNQWYSNAGHQYYFGANGARVQGTGNDGEHLAYSTINGQVYAFDRDGVMKTGFISAWHNLYYFKDNSGQTDPALPTGARLTNGWYTNWGHKYYFGKGGVRATGNSDRGEQLAYRTINGQVYAFDHNGIMKTGFIQAWGHTYYFKDNNGQTDSTLPTGARLTNGWYTNWGHRYYFGNGGVRVNGTGNDGTHLAYPTINGQVYAFDRDGVMKTGFIQAWGKIYYFKDNGGQTDQSLPTGARLTNGWYTNWGHKYYFGNGGVRVTGNGNRGEQLAYRTINGQIYAFDRDGIMKTGFIQAWGHTYYFKDNGGQTDQSLPTGARLTNGWYTNWGHKYYFGNGGVRVNGTGYDGAHLAYRTINGQVYAFDRDGVMKTGYLQAWGKTYYFAPNGARYTNQFLTQNGHTYYFDNNGVQVKGQTITLNGQRLTFDSNGALIASNDLVTELRSNVAREVATVLTNKGYQGIQYDFENPTNHYNEFALHDMAQLVAKGDADNQASVIEKLLAADDNLNGKLLSSYVTDFKPSDNSTTLVNNYVNGLTTTNLNHAIVGVGFDSTHNKLAILIFKQNPNNVPNPQPAQATSKINGTVQDVYKNGGVTVNLTNGLKKGDSLDPTANAALSTGISKLLTGDKGTAISQDVLEAIFASLPGNATALSGTKTYQQGGQTYYYQYWLEGQNDTDKLNNFLNANKGVKYGEPLTVNYSATLYNGTPAQPDSDSTDTTPTSQKTTQQINLAYQTGGETGLRYDSVKVQKIPGMTDDMIRGVDISSYQALINAGVKFYDFNGHEANLFKVLHDAGVNWVRIRVWNDPYNKDGFGYSGGTNDEASLIKMARQASQYGMKVLVDFHYSDFWADPAKQPLPKAWEGLSTSALNDEIRLYTSKVLSDLQRAGANVGMVQVGNEVTNGAFGMWTDRDHGGSWSTLWNSSQGTQVAKYLATAASAVRSTLPNAKIAIQLETPNISKYRSIMTVLKNNNVDYDYLGTSYYPFWSTHDGNGWYDGVDLKYGASTPLNLEGVEKMAQKEFGKKVVVLETGWINNVNDADGTGNSIGSNGAISAYRHDPQGQVDEMSDLYKALVAQGGVGAFWWEPAWIPVRAGWQNWEFNDRMSDLYGTGWASKYAVGYAPDSVMYWTDSKGQRHTTWGGTTWDNVTLFDDHGYPLQSLNMYKGFLNGYQTPVQAQQTSTITAKVNQIFNNTDVTPNDGLKANGTVATSLITNSQDANLLKGHGAITSTQLQTIAASLKDGVKSPEYTAANGAKYHYEFWLDGNNATTKATNFANQNQGKQYGQALMATYSATVVVDSEPTTPAAKTVTSPIQIKLSEVNNSVNGTAINIGNPLKVGDQLTSTDLPMADFNTKNLKSLLTGADGHAISQADLAKLQSELPGTKNGLNGLKTYSTASGDNYYYQFWPKQVVTTNAKYGSPVQVEYGAYLKWQGKTQPAIKSPSNS